MEKHDAINMYIDCKSLLHRFSELLDDKTARFAFQGMYIVKLCDLAKKVGIIADFTNDGKDGTDELKVKLHELTELATGLKEESNKRGLSHFADNCDLVISAASKVKWNTPEPQQLSIEGKDGELAGNGNEARPDDAAGNDNEPQYIELPDVLKISDKAQPVFTEAVAKGWMEVISDDTAEWIGVTQPNELGIVKAKWRQLAYMCGEIYGFKYDLVNNQYGNQGETVPWTDLQNYFGISDVVNLAHEYAGAMEARNRPPVWRKVIDKMISSISI